jgi:hypothetical protein
MYIAALDSFFAWFGPLVLPRDPDSSACRGDAETLRVLTPGLALQVAALTREDLVDLWRGLVLDKERRRRLTVLQYGINHPVPDKQEPVRGGSGVLLGGMHGIDPSPEKPADVPSNLSLSHVLCQKSYRKAFHVLTSRWFSGPSAGGARRGGPDAGGLACLPPEPTPVSLPA